MKMIPFRSRDLAACGALVWMAMLATQAMAQAPNEFDFDTAQLPVQAAASSIGSTITYTGQNLAVAGSLVVHAGGELKLVRSVLTVTGDILMEQGSQITVMDSSLLMATTGTQRYTLRNEGGLLLTERSVLGSAPVSAGMFQSLFLHLRGTWVARQTVVQGLVTTIASGRAGWYGNPLLKGGSIFADGLYEGDLADAIQMSGMGDGVFANGTMNIGLHFDASSSAVPANATIDLESQVPLSIVYGDPLVHSGVTAALAGHPCRIELRNHRSPTWQFFAANATTNGPLQTITLRNTQDILCSFSGLNLVGSPVLGGPWANYYADLPGLPSTGRPGHHALPPGCSVRLGNVKLQSGSGANDWNRIRAWGLYSQGSGTNLSVTGPSLLAEFQLSSGGQATLAGTGSFDMGVFANTVRLYQGASLQVTNAAIGAFGTGAGSPGIIEVNSGSSCSITDSRSARVYFRAVGATSSITAHNLFGASNVLIDTTGGGQVQIAQATSGQDWDLQNLGFESALIAGLPPNWSAQSVSGSRVVDAPPGASSTYAFECSPQSNNATLSKHLSLPESTTVTVLAAAKVLQPPASGQLLWEASHGSSLATKATSLVVGNTWPRLQVPLLTVGASSLPVALGFHATGAPALVRLDEVRVQIGSWWDNDNFANLDFEQPCRHQGQAPTYWSAPDAWRSFRVRCEPDSGVVRPGAAPGSQSIRLQLQAGSGSITKDFTFLRTADQLVVSGYARGVSNDPAAYMQAILSDGANTAVIQLTPVIRCDAVWHPFSLAYTVPPNPGYTRLTLTCFDTPGAQCWFDDLTAEVR